MWYVALQNSGGYGGPWRSLPKAGPALMLGQALNSGYLQEGVFLPFLWVPLQYLIILILRNIRTYFLIPVRICDLGLLPFVLPLGA